MYKSSGKISALQQALAKAQPEHVRRLLEPKFLFGVGAALLLLLSVFCAWQSWLVLSEIRGRDEAEQVRVGEVDALSKRGAYMRLRIITAVNSDGVTGPLTQGGENATAAAADALKQLLPELIGVE